jgi:high-affinity Fe2+/Pb2+ permease
MTLEFIVFGIIDNLVMIIGAMTGCEVEKYLPSRFQKGLGTVVGAGLGNALSDWLGGAGAGNFSLANGTALGCIIGLLFIPIILYIQKLFKSN